MAQSPGLAELELPAWKNWIAIISGVLLAIIFIGAGLYKMTGPYEAAARMRNALVPGSLSLFTAVSFGLAETFAGILLLIPSMRRLGGWLTALMLIAFMVFIGVNYTALQGADCTCFPWLKRAIGPGFFIGDGVMLLLAVLAVVYSKPSANLKQAGMILGAVGLCAAIAFGLDNARQSGTMAPEKITVDGKPTSLHEGKIFLYFFDPECSHCDAAARRLAKHTWNDVKIIGLPSRVPQFGAYFMTSTNLKGLLSPDHNDLKKVFPFGDPPYAVPLLNGRQQAALSQFDGVEPEATLRKLGFIQ